jgi:hypothetical protein
MSRRLGVPAEAIKSIKFREPTGVMEAPLRTLVQLIREAFTERSASGIDYDAAVSLLGVPPLIDLVTVAGTLSSPWMFRNLREPDRGDAVYDFKPRIRKNASAC